MRLVSNGLQSDQLSDLKNFPCLTDLMDTPLSDPFVVGISSSALFETQKEHDIWINQGVPAFVRHQIDHEEDFLLPGTAFPLIQALLRLNMLSAKPVIEVVVVSQNNPAAALRILKSADHHGLTVIRSAFLSGCPVAKYLLPLRINLFLSKNPADVKSALQLGVPAGFVADPPNAVEVHATQLRIAFDADAVIFSDDAEKVYQKLKSVPGAYQNYEAQEAKAGNMLPAGPFAPFLRWIARIQKDSAIRNQDTTVPIRTALVTARNGHATKRVILTLRDWGIEIDELFSMGTETKDRVLRAFQPHIFFDDRADHVRRAAAVVPAAQVLMGIAVEPEETEPAIKGGRAPESVPAEMPSRSEQPNLFEVPVRRSISQKSFDSGCREVFRQYTPLRGQKSGLDPQFLKFLRENGERSGEERVRVLENLQRYGLSDLPTHDPMLNREFSITLDKKLAKISETAESNKP